MNANEFRGKLQKIMPGYKWTVHKSRNEDYLSATGIQSAGFNRLSTLEVVWRLTNGGFVEYIVKSSGFGKRAPWLSEYTAETLARALRGLQNHYENKASQYSQHAWYLRQAREKPEGSQ